MPNGRCKFHGGMSLAGVASPRYTHGRYIGSLPARMVERAQAAYDDPDALSLRGELALCAARIAELLSMVDGDPAADTPGAERADVRKDVVNRMQAAVAEHGAAGVWREVRLWLEQYRRLQEAEVRRGVALMQSVNMEQLVGVIGVLVGIVADHVRDRDVLARIERDVRARLLSRPETLNGGAA